MRSKVRWAANDDPAYASYAACHELAVVELSDPERKIDVLSYEIDLMVGEAQTDSDVRVDREERGYDRQDMQTAEREGSGQDQLSPWSLILARSLSLSFSDLFEDASAGGKVATAGFSEFETAR